jgi:ribose 5-phosphate isomerase B
MTTSHLETIHMLYPEAAEKTFLLGDLRIIRSVRSRSLIPSDWGLMPISAVAKRCARCFRTSLKYIEQSVSAMTPAKTSAATLRVALGADHGGVELKRHLHEHLSQKGMVVSDFGSFSSDSVDYPDFAKSVCAEIVAGHCDYGILVCRSGMG